MRVNKIVSEYRHMLYGFLGLCTMIWLVSKVVLPVYANTVTAIDMGVFEGVTVSPNGQAWTTDYMDLTKEQLPQGFTIHTGAESNLPSLMQGEHYYKKPAEGSVNIGRWVVRWSNAQCIHPYSIREYMGFQVEEGICGQYYNNGWFAYCADCGECIARMHIYAKSETVKGITSMPAKSVYLYVCPHCRGLEQGSDYQHICKAVSANRYSISYQKNVPDQATVVGYMPDTYHMFNNATEYEGLSAEELGYNDKRLRTNVYSCTGYVFEGWNTEADGSGQSFSDAEEIWNLTDKEGEVVPLYAQWKKSTSTLVIDANGGTYQGENPYEVVREYHTVYELQSDLLIPQKGYIVQFETNGGSSVDSIVTRKAFAHWEAQSVLSGSLQGNLYTFGEVDGSIDTVKAQYYNVSFKLPDSVRENESLTGWYTEPDFQEESYVGKPGDAVTVDRDTILYAKWAALTLWAYDDYESHSGVGAVDLKWEQKDGKSKYYKLYQSLDMVDWKEIYKADSIEDMEVITEEFDSNSQGINFGIHDTGYYTLTATGAKGADFSTDMIGGNGGTVTATYWLKQGDELLLYVGTTGSGVEGGRNGSDGYGGASEALTGCGGGAGTEIYLVRNGTTVPLLIGGGGGGANEKASGEDGGCLMTDIGTMNGHTSDYGGGGGGAQGGAGGQYAVHNHEGDPEKGGGCYIAQSGTKICGTAYEEVNGYWECVCGATWGTGSNHYYQGLHAGCGGTSWIKPKYRCSGCQIRLNSKEAHRIDYTYYVLDCLYKDEPDGFVISADAACGGSHYINMDYGCKEQSGNAGDNSGEGYARIESVDIGYREEKELKNVLAKDTAAPEKVSNWDLSLLDEQKIKVTFTRPQDNGSEYYHIAKSFIHDDTLQLIATSNITKNILTTGTAGYYYYVDRSQNGEVNNNCLWTAEDELVITMTEATMYLHIAAVDHAGNISEICDIRLQAEELPTDDDYPDNKTIYTEQLTLEDSEFVYKVDEETYYVKADGVTKHQLQGAAYLDGAARQDFQIDSLRFYMEDQKLDEWLQITVPHINIQENSQQYSNADIQYSVSEDHVSILSPVMTVAERSEHGAILKVSQDFTVQSGQDTFMIYPKAIAGLRGTEYYSDAAIDAANGLVLIPDGIPPEIDGLEELESFDILDMTENTKQFALEAFDEGSGLKEFKILISNADNFMEREFIADDSGRLILQIDKEDPLFMGEIIVSAIATDRVGNVNCVGENGITFTLEAVVCRERNPDEHVFKTGDGAILSIITTGYADRVEVVFPEEFLVLNPDLNRTYEYEYPYLKKTEELLFHIPLGIPEKEYEILVKAWKNGQMLISRPTLVIVEGNVLDELRTRIRNNN